MKKIVAFPTWIIIRLGSRFYPNGHPFKRKIPLAFWHKHETDICKQFDFIFWIASIMFVVIIVRLITLL